MRRLLFQMRVSLDGYFEGPQGPEDLGWHVVDEEFNGYMASYWPTPAAIEGRTDQRFVRGG